MIQFILNNQSIQTEQAIGSTLLDFVRYHKHLKGTKIGCREGDCGACTILVGQLQEGRIKYQSMTSCLMPLSNANGKHIVTIEGLNMETLSPIQQSIVDQGGTQCGFCTVGFVLSLAGLALSKKDVTAENTIAAIDGNICRCTGYKSLERAATKIASDLKEKDQQQSIQWLIDHQFIPEYFNGIPERLEVLADLARLLPRGKKSSTDEPAIVNPSVDNSTLVGGGTDLWVQRPEEMVQSTINPLFDQSGLKDLYANDGVCYIGAANTATDLLESSVLQSHFPRLNEHMKLVSSTPIRNMGTIGGNLVNASPIGDLTIFFLALDASIRLNENGNIRDLKLRDFYKGYKQLDRNANEIVEAIFFQLPMSNDFFNFEKVCKRTHLDIASVNSACWLQVKGQVIEQAHLSAGGVGPTPKYLHESVQALKGQTIHPALIKKVAKIIQEEISPISDARGTADYKRLLLRQLFYAHFLRFFPEKIQLQELV